MSEVLLPAGIEEALEALDHHPRAAVYAGGTDLLVQMRAGIRSADVLVCLERVTELRGVVETGDRLRIGAATTHAALAGDPLVRRRVPVLADAVATIGSPMIRNMGTLGGNICTASPAGDSLPPLTVLGATVELRRRGETRTLPLADFITGPGQTDLLPGELLISVEIPLPAGFNRQRYEKVGRRRALACAVVSLAALLDIDGAGVTRGARLAWGAVGPTVVTVPAVEKMMVGRRLTPEALRAAAPAARAAMRPVDDVRAGAAYRREVAGNLMMRLAEDAVRPRDGAP